ncbi:MAG: DUF1080 domain-containing protein [Pirellulaceae bacterium]|nr:DUF1080 domain-containing protein [Pirellulaceae bacterium]
MFIFAMVCAALISSPGMASAQEKKSKGPAFTEPPKDDPSFDLMGEFVGPITIGENETQALGIQVRPTGRDGFEAISFMGGLPGQPEHQTEMTKMIGRRSGDFLVLSGGPWAIFVEKDHCKLIGREGQQLGRLDRIQRRSPTLNARPPAGANVIFDGSNIDHFTNAQMTKDGLLMEGSDFRPMFQDFNLHVEFRLPYMPLADGQSRGNSGLYLQSRYECQVLDSFGTERMINGCGALYQFKKPDLNMSFPPLVWQTYDVQFTAPRWASDGSKIRDAHLTTWVNGVKVQDNVALPNKTGAGKTEEPVLLPIKLQDHGDPVRFRNIWLVDRGLAHMGEFPVMGTDEEPIVKTSEAETEETNEAKSDAKKNKKPSDSSDTADKDTKKMKENQPVGDSDSADKPESAKEGPKQQPAAPSQAQPEDSKADKSQADKSPAEKPQSTDVKPAENTPPKKESAEGAAAE